jgi:hypothetical protein
MKFLEFYFGGTLMKTAARAAGYRGASDQSLCNTGKAILTNGLWTLLSSFSAHKFVSGNCIGRFKGIE